MSRKTFLQFIFGLIAILFLWTLSPAQPAAATPNATCTSTGNGNWGTPATWAGCTTPQAGDDVIIEAGHTINMNVTSPPAINSLTINTGGTLSMGNTGGGSGTARTLTVTSLVLINGSLTVNTGSNTTHSLVVGGNFTNAGTFNARPDTDSLLTVIFNGTANQLVSGTGTTTNFNLITVNNTGGAGNNIVEIASTNFAPRTAGGFLTLTNGILRLAGSYTLSNNVFTIADYTIPATAGIWLDNPNVTVTAQGDSATLNGLLRISQGTYNIGTDGNNRHLNYGNNSRLIMEGGTLNITCYFRGVTVGNIINFQMIGGNMTVMNKTSGDCTNTGLGSFDISATGSSFTMHGGTIFIGRENTNSTNTIDYRNVAGTVNITGGTVQFGNSNSPNNETYNAGDTGGTNLNVFPSVVVFAPGANAATVTLRRNTVIYGSLTINNNTTFVATGNTVTISGDWTNNGTFTTGGTATRMTTFNGTSPQTIGGSSNSVFSSITINSGAHVILPGNPTQVQAAAAGTITNNGTLQQTRTVNNATVQFMTISTDRYRGVDINTVNNLGDVTVTIRGNSGPTCTSEGAGSPNYAFRCFDIAPTNQAAARVTLWATTGEQNGIATANLAVYRFNLGDWQVGTARTTGTGTNSYVFAQGDVPGFSGFLLGNVNVVPTAITLGQMTTAQPASWVGVGLVGLLLLLLTAGWLKRVSRMP